MRRSTTGSWQIHKRGWLSWSRRLQALSAHSGAMFKTVGDSYHAVFARALDALAAALTAQRALQAEAWGEIGPLRVRMALQLSAEDIGALATRTEGWIAGLQFAALAMRG